MPTAMQLVAAGASVTVAGLSAENVARAQNAGLVARQVDVLDRDALRTFFASLEPIDYLVNAATGGGRALGPFMSMDLDAYEGSFRKLWGYVNAVQIAGPYLAENASIVLVSGAPARRARPGQVALASVGGAVEAFVRAVAQEIAPVRINTISPGVIDTPLIKGEPRRTRGAHRQGDGTQSHSSPRQCR